MKFKFEDTPLDGLKVIHPAYMEDERGNFLKSFEKEIFSQNGIEMAPFEVFESLSTKGVLRGLHFQTKLPQAKLVRTVTGNVFDVAVDIRKDFPTFGKWHSVELSGANKKMFYIPPYFAHGFLVLSESAIVSYICAGRYLKEYDSGILWKDPVVAIEWPISIIGEVTVSKRDESFGGLVEFMGES